MQGHDTVLLGHTFLPTIQRSWVPVIVKNFLIKIIFRKLIEIFSFFQSAGFFEFTVFCHYPHLKYATDFFTHLSPLYNISPLSLAILISLTILICLLSYRLVKLLNFFYLHPSNIFDHCAQLLIIVDILWHKGTRNVY